MLVILILSMLIMLGFLIYGSIEFMKDFKDILRDYGDIDRYN